MMNGSLTWSDGRHDVAEEERLVAVAVVDQHRLMMRGVARRRDHAHAGREFGFAVDELEQLRVGERREVLGEVAGAVALVRMRRVVEFAALDDVARALEHRLESAGRGALGRAARVIEVQMGHHDVVDRLGLDAGGAQVLLDALVVIDAVDLALARGELVAVAGLDQRALAVPLDEQAVGRVLDAVELVAGDEPVPQRLGNDAVHGAAVEAEVAAVDQRERQIAELHAHILMLGGAAPASK